MLGFDDAITIYNTKYNPVTGFDEYHRTVVRNVSWHSQNKAVGSDKGIVFAEVFKVRVPEFCESDKTFVLPEDYANPVTEYTFAPGNMVFKGELLNDVANGKQLAALVKSHSQSFTVLSWHDNRRIGLKHVYVEGK